MRKFTLSIAAAALAVFPAAAAQTASVAGAQSSSVSGNPAESGQSRARANRAADGDRTICMRVQTGASRVTRRVCRTESEWQARGELDNDPR